MSTPPSHFERLSFWSLLQRHPVQIPVIQRDYAQGRTSKAKVIDSFVHTLQGAVHREPVELDFIYGDVKNGVFRPLDGQQRLTTLFLLHWYAARASGLAVDSYTANLERFSYDTRVSSRDFCKNLVREPIALRAPGAQSELSERIRDYAWFVGAWEFDPTIAGMLAVLDKIAVQNWPDDLWSRLTSDAASPIKFLLVKLEKFGLSDDLYIKMNARGKPLTAFESFKALLGERVSEENWECSLSLEERFAIRVDTRWTDFFWQFCPMEASGLKRIDGAFLSFFTHSLACSIARHASTAEAVAEGIQKLLHDPEAMEPDQFTETHYRELRDRLELLSMNREALSHEDREHWEFLDGSETPKVSILEEITQTRGPQYRRRLILYAQLRLLEGAASASPVNVADWRRVVRNVIAHSVVESPKDFVAGIRLLDELAQGVSSIHRFLASAVIQSGFASSQVQDEQRKARLLIRYPEQKPLLHRLEATYFLRGQISFALDCVNEDANPETFDFARLADVAAVIESEFGKGISPEIRRAFFTIGDGNFFRYWTSWFYAKNLPKYCLIYDDRAFRGFTEPHHPSRNALKAFVVALMGKTCAQLIKEYTPASGTPNWRTRLIQEEDLIQRATGHHIALDEPNAIVYPIDGVRPHNNATTQRYLDENKIQ